MTEPFEKRWAESEDMHDLRDPEREIAFFRGLREEGVKPETIWDPVTRERYAAWLAANPE
jgi:hypothetical protein